MGKSDIFLGQIKKDMDGNKRKSIFIFIILPSIIGACLLLFFLIGPPKLLAKTDKPGFCIKCHVMEPYYESWFHSGAHKRKNCVECHLPNDSIGSHYAWKAIFGLKEVIVYYTGNVPEPIKITSHGGKVLQSNCIRCHEITVMLMDKERRCWDCHKRISHIYTGITETF